MKKLLAIALTLAMLVSAFAVGAITLDTAESAEASYVPEEAVLAAATPDIPMYSQYGELIYYSNMETDNASLVAGIAETTWFSTDFMSGVSIEKAGGTLTKHADPENPDNSVVLLAGSTSWHQYVGGMTNFYPKEGKYTVVYDAYVPSMLPNETANSNANGWMSRFFTTATPQKADGTAVAGDSISLNTPTSAEVSKIKNVWRTFTYAGVVDAYDGGYTFGMDIGTKYYYPDNADGTSTLKIKEFRLIPNTISVYIDNVRIYYMPENGISFKFGDNSAVKSFEGNTYVLPEPTAVDAAWTGDFYGWIIDGVIYDAGDEVTASVVGGKKVVALEIPLFDVEKGDLVFLYNYDGDNASHLNPTYLNTTYLEKVNSNRADGSDGSVVGTDGSNGFVKVYSTQNTGARLYGPCFDPIGIDAYYTVKFDYEYVTPAAHGGTTWVRLNPNTGNEWDNDIYYTKDASGVGSVEVSKRVSSGIKAVNMNLASVKDADGVYYPTEVRIDNFALYAFPATKFVFKPSEDAETYVSKTADGDTYVMPDPAALGLSVPDFMCWTDGLNYYNAGDTVEVAKAGGKIYYPFAQSADIPAVISIFEGNTTPGAAKVAYTELIEDEGRDVLHGHFWKSTWTNNSGTYMYMNDTRIALTHPGFDAGEYSIISIMSKNPAAYNTSESKVQDTTVYEAKTSTQMTLYNYINRSYAYNGNSRIGSFVIDVDNEYHLTEINMGEVVNASYPWETTGFGFALDPNCVNYGGDFYIDYVRIYRSGLTTVTYNTNAPAEATVVSNVDPDEGRGLGTGYLLKDERPVVEGYTFLGWAKEKDATAEDVVTAIDLTGDTTVYAVWAKNDNYKAADMLDKQEIRSGGTVNGIRFKTSVAVSDKDKFDEIGFIATREVLLPVLNQAAGTYDYTALNFGYLNKEAQKADEAPLYVYGAAYNKAENIDIINENVGTDTVIYSAVFKGIPLENKNEKIVVRSYAKFDVNGNAVTVYGTPKTTSLYDTAKAIKDAEGADYNDNKTYIDSIVTE